MEERKKYDKEEVTKKVHGERVEGGRMQRK